MFEPHSAFFSPYCSSGEDVGERMGRLQGKVAGCGAGHTSVCAGSHRQVNSCSLKAALN